jgi:sRNA-binding protein
VDRREVLGGQKVVEGIVEDEHEESANDQAKESPAEVQASHTEGQETHTEGDESYVEGERSEKNDIAGDVQVQPEDTQANMIGEMHDETQNGAIATR